MLSKNIYIYIYKYRSNFPRERKYKTYCFSYVIGNADRYIHWQNRLLRLLVFTIATIDLKYYPKYELCC